MSKHAAIVLRAVSLLRSSSTAAGITAELKGGELDVAVPELGGITGLLAVHGLVRSSELRPVNDIRLYIDEFLGTYTCRLERITGIAPLDTIPDPTEHVATIKALDLDALGLELLATLDKIYGVDALTMTSLFYRKSEFATAIFENVGVPRPQGFFPRFVRKQTDAQLEEFVNTTVESAFAFGGTTPLQSCSLWFTLGETMRTIYIRIEAKGDKYRITADDRVDYPWREKAINTTCTTPDAVKRVIRTYIAERYSFRVEKASVYLGWHGRD